MFHNLNSKIILNKKTLSLLKIDKCFLNNLNRNFIDKLKDVTNIKCSGIQKEKLKGFSDNSIDYYKFMNKVNFSNNDHPSLNLIRYYLNNMQNEKVYFKKYILNLFAECLNHKFLNKSNNYLSSQNKISEIVQFLHITHLVHSNLLNVNTNDEKYLHDGNKLSILGGDFLYATIMKILSDISNTDITCYITDVFYNITEGQYILSTSSEEIIKNYNFNTWLELNGLIHASSFKAGCKSMIELSKGSDKIKNLAQEFGENLAFALQAISELKQINEMNSSDINSNNSKEYVDFFILPLILDINFVELIPKIKPNSFYLKPVIEKKVLKNHLTNLKELNFYKTQQFIEEKIKSSIYVLDEIFCDSNSDSFKKLKNIVNNLAKET